MNEQNGRESKQCSVRCQKVGEETVVHDEASGRVFFLNRTASEVMQMWQGGLGEDEIAQKLKDACVADNDTDVTRDVAACLEELRQLGLLEVTE